MRIIPKPSPDSSGKIAFHKTGPWCQKVWGPLWWNGLVASRCQCMVTLNFKAGSFLPESSKVYQDSSFRVTLPSLAFPSDTVLQPHWPPAASKHTWLVPASGLCTCRRHTHSVSYIHTLTVVHTHTFSVLPRFRPIMLSLPGSPSGSLQVSSWRPPSRPVAPSLAPSCPPFGIGLLCISLVNHGFPCTLSYLMSALFFLSKYMFLEGAFVCQLQITQNRVLQEILAERNDFLNLKSTAKKYSS